MNWPGKIECKLCGQTETTDHIIFQCAVAQFSWCVCRDILEWPFPPTSLNDLREIAREGSNRQIKNILFLFGCVAWSLWLIRNYLVFNNLVVFSQKWKILSKEKEQLWINMVTQKLKLRLSSLRSEDDQSA
uniref:Uncharacterized protein n=1 Tax=Setaria italica TaxID=4555 RepID=K3XPL7_SETIT